MRESEADDAAATRGADGGARMPLYYFEYTINCLRCKQEGGEFPLPRFSLLPCSSRDQSSCIARLSSTRLPPTADTQKRAAPATFSTLTLTLPYPFSSVT